MSNRKLHNRLAFAAAVCLAPAAAFARAPMQWPEEGYTYRDYRQDGLVAHWDAKNICGPGAPLYYHYASITWSDLVGARKLTVRDAGFDNELGPYTGNGSTYWGKMTLGSTDILAPREEGVTVEVVLSTRNESMCPILLGPRESGIAIAHTGGSRLVLDYEGLDENKRPTYNWEPYRTWDKQPSYTSLSVCYTNGVVDLDHSFINGVQLAPNGSFYTGGKLQPDGSMRVLSSAKEDIGCGAYLHAIRIYHGKLSAEEVEQHRLLDRKRYCQLDFYTADRLFYAFTVKSGSVTVGGTAYAAGDFVYYRNDVAVPVEAENAVIVPRKDGAAKIEIVSGKLKIETDDALAMAYVKELAIGASGTLNVSSMGLNVVSLTAATGAKATGAGTLVSTNATAPVAYANYRCANETFAGWPSGGTAYVPSGVEVPVTAAQAAALDAIVFMDDGTDAAKTTTVSYTESSALTLKARLAGHGVFSATTHGKLTITGDNRNFTGRFVFNDVNTLVTHPYGLGFEGSEMSEIAVGANGYCHFDDGTDVFTNHAPIRIWTTNASVSACRAIIGSESLSKTLVQAGEFENNEINVKASGYNPQQNLFVQNNLTLLKGWYCNGGGSGRQLSPALYMLNPGRFVLYGNKIAPWWGTANIYRSKGAEAAEIVVALGNHYEGGWYLNDNMTFGAVNALNCPASTTIAGTRPPKISADGRYCQNSVMDLNGYDQIFGWFAFTYVPSDWTRDVAITSATPATVTLRQSTDVTMRIPFLGAAALTYAMDAGQTNKLSDAVSETTGALTVKSGRLDLVNGYRWLGGQVVVDGGELWVSDTSSFGKLTCLYVTAEPLTMVRLPDDSDLVVRAFKYCGAWMPAGRYGGAAALAAGKIDADHCLDCFDSTSTGVLNVRTSTGEQQGFVLFFH